MNRPRIVHELFAQVVERLPELAALNHSLAERATGQSHPLGGIGCLLARRKQVFPELADANGREQPISQRTTRSMRGRPKTS